MVSAYDIPVVDPDAAERNLEVHPPGVQDAEEGAGDEHPVHPEERFFGWDVHLPER